MWLLCPRRHVVGGPFPSPAVVSRRQLPFIQIQVSSLSLYTMRSVLDYSRSCLLNLAPRFSILVLSRSVLYPWPSIPHIPALRHPQPLMHSLPWSSILHTPGSSSVHSRRCVLFLLVVYSRHFGSSSTHSRRRDLYIPVLCLGRLCLAFSTSSPTVSLTMHPRIRPSSKPRISLAHLGNFSYSPSLMHSHITAAYLFNLFSV